MKEILNQFLHMLSGIILVLVFVQFMPLPMAVVFALTTGIVREIYQRYDRDRKWYDCQAGCRLDLFFWGLGAVVGTAAIFFWRQKC